MAEAADDVDRAITALHEGVFEQPTWATFLDLVGAIAKADYASIVFRRADARFRDICVINAHGASHSADDLTPAANLPYDDLEPGRPYALHEIVDPQDARHADYIEYLEQRGMRRVYVIRMEAPDGGSGWFSIGRSQGDFGPGVALLLRRLGPHLSLAARTLSMLERERLRADIAAHAVRRLNFGWLTFDARAAVMEIDEEATRLFRDLSDLKGVGPGHSLPLKAAARQALAATLSTFAARPEAPPRAIHLSDEPWLDMLVAPVRYRPVSRGVTPVAVGYVHGVGGDSADRCEHLMQLFALTRGEARIAIALTQGKSLAQAAEELGFTLETARNYSKKVYAKTATRGQADLVRLILASVVALA